MLRHTSSLLAAAALLAATLFYAPAPAHAGMVLHGIGNRESYSIASSAAYKTWIEMGVDGAGTTHTMPRSGTIGSTSFNYNITVTAVNTGDGKLKAKADTYLGNTNQNNELFDSNQGFSLAVTVAAADQDKVKFDGFTALAISHIGDKAAEGGTVNATEYKNDSNNSIRKQYIDIPDNLNFTFAAIGTTTGNFVEYQFSTIPEPASVALWGAFCVAGLGYGWRRKLAAAKKN